MWRLPKRGGPNSLRAADVVLRGGQGQSSHSMMIKLKRLVSAEALRKKKLDSLRKQIAKLEKLKF